ncbi:recombinase family protein [Vogesella fluminis]|uniref:Resolvase n=1 Tax=Vogesella fluminis TaxID=1069161 RepID=A0ABQ3H951_9NEIS|nr:recombinase family protein [Vogesella fluminis]GHD76936.1 resolvase [Vogesella fluminis]
MKTARIYIRVSTDQQDTSRQHQLIEQAKAAGYYVAGVYSEKASGTIADRPELQRMIGDLQPGDVVIAEKIDRISRLPLPEAEKLIAAIKAKGAKLSVPGIVDLSEIEADGVAKIVLDAVQDMLLKLALQMARDDYETRRERQTQGIAIAKQEGRYAGRKADAKRQQQVIALREAGKSLAEVADLTGYSVSNVKKVLAANKEAKGTAEEN